jgi:hypothetical protein
MTPTAERWIRALAVLCCVVIAACTQDGERDGAENPAIGRADGDAAGAEPPALTAPAPELPGYQALPDSVVDVPAHTHVERRLIVTDTVDTAQLEALLRAEFDAVMNSGPFAHRERPTHVYIRIYDSEARSRRPALWRAMLRFGPGADEPAIQTENAVLQRELDR